MGRPRKQDSHAQFINPDAEKFFDPDYQESYKKTIQEKDSAAKIDLERKHYPSIAERIAQSSHMIRNYKFHKAEESFRNNPRMWTVDMYFPYAMGGELLIDQVAQNSDIPALEPKREVLNKLGYRYLILRKDMTDNQALEELSRI